MSLRNITLVEGLPFNVPPIEDITDELPKIQSWDILQGKQNIVRGVWDGTYHMGLRKPEETDTIMIHHSGPPEGTLISHANYHAKQWGAGIAYHIGIDELKIKQLNDLLSFTFHASGNNTYTVSIMVNADLSKRELTSRERELLYAAILSVKAVLPIKYIRGHNEVNATACPCTSMNQIREDIAKLELQMKMATDPKLIKHKCYTGAMQHTYLNNQYIADPVGQKYLEEHLVFLYEEMKRRGLFFGQE